MGWCSGTPIFDRVAEKILLTELSDDQKEELIFTLADAMADQDWDCEGDSKYWDHPLVRKAFKRVWPYIEEDETGEGE